MVEDIILYQQRLNEFINQYYLNKFIRGLFFFAIGFLIIFLTSSFIEYFAWASNQNRLFLLLGSILGIFFIFYYFLIVPICRYFKIFSQITHKHAIGIIAKHFPSSKDILINIYELGLLYKKDSANNLLEASIFQKAQISYDFDFSKAVDKRNFVPLLKYLAGLVVMYLFILIFSPEIITDSSSRIFHYNTFYEKNIGFSITIDSSELVVEKGKNRKITIKLKGNKFPDNLNLQVNGQEFLLSKKSNELYTYEFKNLVNSFTFRIVNSYYSSKEYYLRVLNAPAITSYSIKIEYPKYLNLENDYFLDVLSLKAPIGSNIIWNFATSHLDSLFFVVDSIRVNAVLKEPNFELTMKLLEDINYDVFGKNIFLTKRIFSKNEITVIPDLYPSITITERQDKLNFNLFYYYGVINDDYGFSDLKFLCNDGGNDTIIPLFFNHNNNNQSFYFSFDYSILTGKEVSSFFVVYDNDELNSFKSTKSDVFYIKKPDYYEMLKVSQQNQLLLEKKVEKSRFLAEELMRDTKEIKKKLLTENLTSFEKSQLIGDLLNKQNNLNEIIKKTAEENLLKSKFDNRVSERDKEILAKNEKIQEMLDSLLTDELKDLFKELQLLQREFNQEKFNDISRDIERNYDELSKQLDTNLELLRKLDIENRIEDLISKLMELSSSQENISKELMKSTNMDSVVSMNKKDQVLAEQLLEEYLSLVEKNKELERPMNIDSLNSSFNNLEKSIENSIAPNNSKEQNSNNANENSDSAKELANELEKMLNTNSENEVAEDSDALRQILENLLYFSFEQESISDRFGHISKQDPKFNDIIYLQFNLNEIFTVIKDSLYAVSKRTPYLGNHISKKAFSIESKLLSIKNFANEENFAKINLEQREIIEYSNDLILLLSESLKKLDSMSNSGGSKTNKKNKAKPGKPSLSEMRKSQDGIKEQLEGMIDKLKNGGTKEGSSNSEKLGKILAQQEVFQQMINQLSGNSGVGKEYSKQLNEISKLLDDNKRDIARMKISPQTIERQQQIVTRLLEAEKAEIERELDNVRISNEARDNNYSIKNIKFEKEHQIFSFEEIFNKSSIQLQYFYKNKYQDYIIKLKNQPDEKRN